MQVLVSPCTSLQLHFVPGAPCPCLRKLLGAGCKSFDVLQQRGPRSRQQPGQTSNVGGRRRRSRMQVQAAPRQPQQQRRTQRSHMWAAQRLLLWGTSLAAAAGRRGGLLRCTSGPNHVACAQQPRTMKRTAHELQSRRGMLCQCRSMHRWLCAVLDHVCAHAYSRCLPSCCKVGCDAYERMPAQGMRTCAKLPASSSRRTFQLSNDEADTFTIASLQAFTIEEPLDVGSNRSGPDQVTASLPKVGPRGSIKHLTHLLTPWTM